MNDHILTITPNPYLGFDGDCSCSNPDLVDDQYVGHVVFHGPTRDSVIDDHEEHLYDMRADA